MQLDGKAGVCAAKLVKRTQVGVWYPDTMEIGCPVRANWVTKVQ